MAGSKLESLARQQGSAVGKPASEIGRQAQTLTRQAWKLDKFVSSKAQLARMLDSAARSAVGKAASLEAWQAASLKIWPAASSCDPRSEDRQDRKLDRSAGRQARQSAGQKVREGIKLDRAAMLAWKQAREGAEIYYIVRGAEIVFHYVLRPPLRDFIIPCEGSELHLHLQSILWLRYLLILFPVF